MSVPPTASPWPAPTLADAAAPGPGRRVPPSAPPAEVVTPRSRHQHAAAARDAARRLVNPSLRAEHAALRQEQRIGEELADLPAGWVVLSPAELSVLDGTIDGVQHVVIGPGGVLMIRIEHQPAANVWVSERAITINGRTTKHLSEARFEARRAGGRLTKLCGFDVTVQSVLVLIGATVHTVSRPAEIHVRAQHDLHDWLCVQPVRLAAEAVSAIHHFVAQNAMAASQDFCGSSITTGI